MHNKNAKMINIQEMGQGGVFSKRGVLKTKEEKKAWKCYWVKGEYIKKELPANGKVDDLIVKN